MLLSRVCTQILSAALPGRLSAVKLICDAPTDEAVDCGFHGDRCVCVRGANGGGFRFDEVNLPEYGI